MHRLPKDKALINNKNQLFSSLANNALIGIGIIQHQTFTFVNRQLAQMSGYGRAQILALHDIQALLPDMHCHLAAFSADTELKEQLIESRLLHYSGFMLDVELCVMQTSYGAKEALAVFVLDISERKRNERSNKVAALVYENSCEAIAVTDARGVIVDVNPAFIAITGYQRAEVVGRSINVLSSGRHNRDFYQKMWQELNATGRWQGDIWNKRKDGQVYAERLNISTCYNEDGSVYRRIGLFFDITQYKAREELIWRQANHDHLTGLPNRQMFQDRLQQAMKEADKQGTEVALIFLDLDLFKDINDTLGHAVGDQLLKEVSKRLLSCVRDSDTVARVGGDEFTIIVSDVPDKEVVERICEQVLIKMAQPYFLGDHVGNVSASIGITMYPEDAKDAGELLKNADMAMYAAKECGRNQYCFFLPAMSEAIQAHMTFSQNLKTALAENQFILYYQPIIDMRTGELRKLEALIRWEHPELGLVPPSEYIPFAEDSGLIVDIGEWVFYAAVQQAKEWQAQGYGYQLSVNVSPVQFYGNGLDVEKWVNIIQEAGLDSSSVVIEITERLLLDENPIIIQNLTQLREAGMQIALDDFGTGFSSLTYLKRYPIDYIKIDQSFVRHLAPNSEDYALCEAMIIMAQKLGLEIIAEGVEGLQQEQLLLEAGCTLGQGYLYSRPIPNQELCFWIEERNRQLANSSSSKDQSTTGELPQRT